MSSSPGPDYTEVADDVWVHKLARLDVERFAAGKGTVINGHARVFGTEVRLGRECWVDEYATIGGGSAFDPVARFVAGDWVALGNYAQVNTARGVHCGHEVGFGIGTRVFTHGAYLSEWDGFPVDFASVTIGSRVWLPNAQVNAGVTIGDDVVCAARAVVTRDIPSNSLAVGAPARVVGPMPAERRRFPEYRQQVLAKLTDEVSMLTGVVATSDAEAGTLSVEGATFCLDERTITGEVTPASEAARNQLRRRGVRFRYEPHDGLYRPWSDG